MTYLVSVIFANTVPLILWENCEVVNRGIYFEVCGSEKLNYLLMITEPVSGKAENPRLAVVSRNFSCMGKLGREGS